MSEQTNCARSLAVKVINHEEKLSLVIIHFIPTPFEFIKYWYDKKKLSPDQHWGLLSVPTQG